MLTPERRMALLRDLETILEELGALTPTTGLHTPTERGRLGLEDLRTAQLAELQFLWALQGRYRADRRYHALVATLQRVEAHQWEQTGLTITALARLAQDRKEPGS
jgi:hypothetical protein